MIGFEIKNKPSPFMDVNHDEFMSMKQVRVYSDREEFIDTEIHCFMLNNGLTKENIEEHAHKQGNFGFDVYKYKDSVMLIIDWPIPFGSGSARVIDLGSDCNCGYIGNIDNLELKET